jgi:dTDP-4-dehydrorhamnose reductase
MSKKALIFGSQGMLATDMARVCTAAGYEIVGLSHSQVDTTQSDQVREALEQVRPDVVFNTPGIAVDTCEVEPEKGYCLHSWAAGVVAQQCQRTNAAVVYISTCGLFGDEVRFYSEYDPVQLRTQYARSKLLGEQATVQACDRVFIIRPGWLFGGTRLHQRNFVYQRYLDAQTNPVMRSANDKFGSPTYTVDLAAKILEIVESEAYGLYHVTNSGCASRFDYVRHILMAFGLTNVVEPVDSSTFPRKAPMPNCELLENLNLRFLGLEVLGTWQEAIETYVAHLKKGEN